MPEQAKKQGPSTGDETIGIWPTPWGVMGAVRGANGVCRIVLPHYSPQDLRDLLQWEHPAARFDAEPLEQLAELCCAYFNGEAADFSTVTCDLAGVGPFGRRILTACREIPYGQTRTYTAVAHMAGEPGKARPAAQALGRNPVPLVIPCHRVVAAGGRLGGFSAAGGVELKQRMLERERRE